MGEPFFDFKVKIKFLFYYKNTSFTASSRGGINSVARQPRSEADTTVDASSKGGSPKRGNTIAAEPVPPEGLTSTMVPTLLLAPKEVPVPLLAPEGVPPSELAAEPVPPEGAEALLLPVLLLPPKGVNNNTRSAASTPPDSDSSQTRRSTSEASSITNIFLINNTCESNINSVASSEGGTPGGANSGTGNNKVISGKADTSSTARQPHPEESAKSGNDILYNRETTRGDTFESDGLYTSRIEDYKKKKEIERINREIEKINKTNISIKDKIIYSKLDLSVKAIAISNLCYAGSQGSSDLLKWTKWAQSLVKIPFKTYKKIPVSLKDGSLYINNFLINQKYKMDKAVYGLEEVKEEILSFIAQQISNPNSKGTVIALEGSPGIGKTKLIRYGIAETMNRYFATINFGGIKDTSLIDGHDMTYLGAKYGRIVQILIQAKHMNPVIYIDEFDKVDEHKAEGIFGILTHLLDEEQNHDFQDNYFQGISIDLSRVIWVISYNDPNKIDSIVKNRFKTIKVQSPSFSDKIVIVKKFIFPEYIEKVKLKNEDLILEDSIIEYIIEQKTEKEDGMRNIKKNIETIVQKINLLYITKSTPTGGRSFTFTSYTDSPHECTKSNNNKVISGKADTSSTARQLPVIPLSTNGVPPSELAVELIPSEELAAEPIRVVSANPKRSSSRADINESAKDDIPVSECHPLGKETYSGKNKNNKRTSFGASNRVDTIVDASSKGGISSTASPSGGTSVGVSGRAGISSTASPRGGTPGGASIYDGINSVASSEGGTSRRVSGRTGTRVSNNKVIGDKSGTGGNINLSFNIPNLNFPLTITKDIVDILLKKNDKNNNSLESMYS